MGDKVRSQTAPQNVAKLLELLQAQWPDATAELDHQNAYQLLVATILAAQSTDKMINQITPELFRRYPDAAALAQADLAELEVLVHRSGFFRAKSRNLVGMARAVVERHGGRIPETMEELVELPGVARKTANVVLGTAFGKNEGIVVDTHVQRLSQRLGLTQETKPEKIEADLMRIVPRPQWTSFAHELIWHGRRICFARAPQCGSCPLAPLCPSADLFGARAGAAPAKRVAPPAAARKSAGKPAGKPTGKPASKLTGKLSKTAIAKAGGAKAKAGAKHSARAHAKGHR